MIDGFQHLSAGYRAIASKHLVTGRDGRDGNERELCICIQDGRDGIMALCYRLVTSMERHFDRFFYE